MELFKLVGKIFIDSNEAQNSISKTGEKADSLGSKLAGGIGTAAKWAAGVGAAATAVGGAMVAMAKDSAESLDVIDKGSQRMKVSAETYQELAYAAGLSGVEMSTMEAAAKKLEGTDLNLDDALQQIMAAGDESERAAAAAELFGENIAYKMTPMLNAGADGLQAMRDEANELGLVMSQDTVTAGASMNDMFSKIEQTTQALKASLAAELMPYVMEILQWTVDNLPKIAETVKTVMDGIMPIVKPILDGILELVSGLFSLINGDFDGFVESISNALSSFKDAIFTLGEGIITSLWDGLKKAWTGVWEWFEEKIEAIKSKFSGLGSLLSAFGCGDVTVTTNGSHAAGLPYVPYDGYVAQLHRGEMVMTANDSANLLDSIKRLADAANRPTGAQAIYLDSGALVGQISPGIDTNLGINYALNARGALT